MWLQWKPAAPCALRTWISFSGSVEKGTNNARVRDYIHTYDKATHCHCQNSRSRVAHARLREPLSMLFLVLISCDLSLNMASFLSSQLELEPKMKPDSCDVMLVMYYISVQVLYTGSDAKQMLCLLGNALICFLETSSFT